MEIKGFVAVSLSDWDGKVSSVIFLPGCNMRCPFCYNKNLVLRPEKMPSIAYGDIESYLEKNRNWIDGVVVTGGEPTLEADLPVLCGKIKKMGFGVKVDTNGTNPALVTRLIDGRLVDYVAMDVKAPLAKGEYSEACGVAADNLLERISETIDILLSHAVECEFRTTVVPTLHLMEDVNAICRAIKGCRKFALQTFKSDVEMIDAKYEKLKPFSQREMENFLQEARKIVPNTILRR